MEHQRVEQIRKAHKEIELAVAQETESGNPVTGAKHYITAMELVITAVEGLDHHSNSAAQKYFLFQCRQKLEEYWERAKLLLSVAEDEGLVVDLEDCMPSSSLQRFHENVMSNYPPLGVPLQFGHPPPPQGTFVPPPQQYHPYHQQQPPYAVMPSQPLGYPPPPPGMYGSADYAPPPPPPQGMYGSPGYGQAPLPHFNPQAPPPVVPQQARPNLTPLETKKVDDDEDDVDPAAAKQLPVVACHADPHLSHDVAEKPAVTTSADVSRTVIKEDDDVIPMSLYFSAADSSSPLPESEGSAAPKKYSYNFDSTPPSSTPSSTIRTAEGTEVEASDRGHSLPTDDDMAPGNPTFDELFKKFAALDPPAPPQ